MVHFKIDIIFLAVYDETDNNPSVFIFGGCTSTSTTFNDLWRLDPTTREWSRILANGTYPSPKACATLVKSKPGELMLFGGKKLLFHSFIST